MKSSTLSTRARRRIKVRPVRLLALGRVAVPVVCMCWTASAQQLIPRGAAALASSSRELVSGASFVSDGLPDAPSAIQGALRSPVQSAFVQPPPAPCSVPERAGSPVVADSSHGEPCRQEVSPYSRFVDSPAPAPLSGAQKAGLAVHNLFDRGNLGTIAGNAAYTAMMNSHTAYGPGFGGFVRWTGTGLLEDGTGQLFGTWLVPALTHQDPRYHRMPHASVPQRLLHAVSHTLVAGSDSGRLMPNYSTLVTYPISAEISNLYVPGVHGNGPSTVKRFLTGYATDPIDNLVTEFLPDLARHVQVHVIFAQQVLNQISAEGSTLP